MSVRTTNYQNIIDIADAINAKAGTAIDYEPSELASAIADIELEGLTEDDVLNRNFSGAFSNSEYTQIKPFAFAYCSSLTSVSFPLCTSIGTFAFYYCSSLTSVDFPACTYIGSSAFLFCSSLTSVYFPVCTSICTNAFMHCSSLTSVDFPVCTSIRNNTFYSCSSLTSVSFPVCTSIDQYAFYYCRSLTTASFPACTSIGTYAFTYCYNLLSLYLTGSSLCSLAGTNAFTSTPISNYTTSTGGVYGSIYVPSSLYASYIAATNWVTYSARFVSV